MENQERKARGTWGKELSHLGVKQVNVTGRKYVPINGKAWLCLAPGVTRRFCGSVGRLTAVVFRDSPSRVSGRVDLSWPTHPLCRLL